MAREKSKPHGDDSYVAGEDLSTYQYRFVESATALSAQGQRTCTRVNAVTDDPVGIVQNKPKSGEAAQVRCEGKSKVVSNGAGTAIVVGDWVGPDATGKAIKKTVADNVVMGKAENPSAADGVIITINMDLKPSRFRAAV